VIRRSIAAALAAAAREIYATERTVVLEISAAGVAD
jgi:hypothetical protein